MQGILKTSFFQNENQFEISENNSDTDRDPSDAFIITIKTDNTGTSNDDQFTLPWIGTYDVDWGDGNTETSVVDTQTHTYASAGTYDVAVTATTGRISFNNSNDALKLLDIKNWGTCAWTVWMLPLEDVQALQVSRPLMLLILAMLLMLLLCFGSVVFQMLILAIGMLAILQPLIVCLVLVELMEL